MKWREISRRVILQTIEEADTTNPKELRKLISKAYPFGERSMWPYKVWLSEVKKQMLVFESYGKCPKDMPLFEGLDL